MASLSVPVNEFHSSPNLTQASAARSDPRPEPAVGEGEEALHPTVDAPGPDRIVAALCELSGRLGSRAFDVSFIGALAALKELRTHQ